MYLLFFRSNRIFVLTCSKQAMQKFSCNTKWIVFAFLCFLGIPMEEDEDERDTSIKGRLLMLVNKIKSQSHKVQEPTEKKQTAPCE